MLAVSRGHLRHHLVLVPGVGKTFAMLNEGRRPTRARHRRGHRLRRDAQSGDTPPRPIGDLEVVRRHDRLPRHDVRGDGRRRLLARRPSRPRRRAPTPTSRVAATRSAGRTSRSCSTLASTSSRRSTSSTSSRSTTSSRASPGSSSARRSPTRWSVPPSRSSSSTYPEALRRRMAHGNIYAPDKVDAALGHYFRPGNLTALRGWHCCGWPTRSTSRLRSYASGTASRPRGDTERVVVAVTGARRRALIRGRRASPQRARGDLIGVQPRGPPRRPPRSSLGRPPHATRGPRWDFHEVAGADVAAALVEFARAENATQLVLGAPTVAWWRSSSRLGRSTERSALRADRRPRHLPRGGSTAGCWRPVDSPWRHLRLSRCRRAAAGRTGRWRSSASPCSRSSSRNCASRWRCRPCCSSTSRWLSPAPRSAARGPPWSPQSIRPSTANWYFTPPIYELTSPTPRTRRPARLPRHRHFRESHRRHVGTTATEATRPRSCRHAGPPGGDERRGRSRDGPCRAVRAAFTLDGARCCAGTAASGRSSPPPGTAGCRDRMTPERSRS